MRFFNTWRGMSMSRNRGEIFLKERSLQPALSFLTAAMVAGVLLAVLRLYPAGALFPYQVWRPMHTLFVLGWVVTGSFTALFVLLKWSPRFRVTGLLASLFLVAAGLVAAGGFTGREYISWPPVISLLLITLFLAAVMMISTRYRLVYNRFAGASWMIFLGLWLLPLSLLEANYYLLDDSLSVGRDIALQWHALDTLFGAVNLVCYGLLAGLMRGEKEPSSVGWKFNAGVGVAMAGLLLTFGHHYYPAPQPELMRSLAFAFSMVALFSIWFKRGTGEVRQHELTATLIRYVLGWTLFSLITGVLMSVPAVNGFTHGTGFVLAHSMGSFIGVNTQIILAVFFSADKRQKAQCRKITRFNVALALFVASFPAAHLFSAQKDFFDGLTPALGAVLTLSFFPILRAAWVASRSG